MVNPENIVKVIEDDVNYPVSVRPDKEGKNQLSNAHL